MVPSLFSRKRPDPESAAVPAATDPAVHPTEEHSPRPEEDVRGDDARPGTSARQTDVNVADPVDKREQEGSSSGESTAEPQPGHNEEAAERASEQHLDPSESDVSTATGNSDATVREPDAPPANSTEAPTTEHPAEAMSFEQAVQDWLSQFAEIITADNQIFKALRVNLDNAHPGGLAQLYVDHPTRLDTLIRESSALDAADAGIRQLSQEAATLTRKYGRADVHLAIGTAEWDGPGNDDIPVLMRRVALGVDEDGEVTLELIPGVEVSTRLLRAIALAGAPIDTGALGEAMRGPDGFLPRTALELIRNAGEALPGFALRESLALGVFTHPAGALYRELAAMSDEQEHPVVRALGGDQVARASLRMGEREPDLGDRDPWRELGLGDQTPAVHDMLERVAQGVSAVVEVRGPRQAGVTTASVAAALAEVGRKVLVVLNRAEEHAALIDALEEGGVRSIVADLSPFGDYFSVSEQLSSLVDGSPSDDALPGIDASQLSAMRTGLQRARQSLNDYTSALHESFEPWGMSPFDALQVLTDLTSLADPPSTAVRLPFSALSALAVDGGEGAAALLDRASELGLFAEEQEPGAWQGVVIEDQEQATKALSALRPLVEELLPAIRMQMSTTAARMELHPTITLDQWQTQLGLLTRVRDSLDVVAPEVLERSPADMVVATAPKQWRKDRNINIKRAQLRALQKQAKDSMRPGVHVEDVHQALIDAQTVRHQWSQVRTSEESTPAVPDQLDELLETLAAAQAELHVLKPLLEPVYGDLDTMPVEELAQTLEALYLDPEGAEQIPELMGILDQLDAMGLHELVLDMKQRGIDGHALSLELDLAWWASALGHMLAQEPRLGGFDPGTLENLLRQASELDEQQIQSLGPALVQHVRDRGREALSLYPEQREQLIDQLSSGVDPASVFGNFNLAWDLLPVVVAGPAVVPLLVRDGRSVDSIVLMDLQGMTPAQTVPLVNRAEQVVAVGEADGAEEDGFLGVVAASLPRVRVPGDRVPVAHIASQILGRHLGTEGHMVVPSPRAAGPFKFIPVDGRGMPAPGMHAIETSEVEVEAVVELVAKQLQEHPREKLAVAVFSERHRERIATRLRRRALEDPAFAQLLDAAGGATGLTVLPAQLAAEPAATQADRVIVSVGFAKTPHGRVIHDFGELSGPDGLKTMEDLALGLRGDVTLVTSIRADEVDRTRLRKPGETILLELLEAAENGLAELPGADDQDEEQVPPQLLVDLAERLHRLGLRVVPNFGVEGGMRIPLAIGHPEVPGELLVAVLTDDDSYVNEPSLRVRGRHWKRMLEGQGWKVHTALSMSVFIDPNREAQEIVRLALDAVDEYYARMGLPHTPAAAAALGLSLPATHRGTSESEPSWDAPAHQGPDSSRITELDVTGALQVLQVDPADVVPPVPTGASFVRGPRPPYATGLPLAAYSDDQLDEMALWVLGDRVERSDEQVAQELRDELGITRRGAQTDAVLLNVARRARALATEATSSTSAIASELAQDAD